MCDFGEVSEKQRPFSPNNEAKQEFTRVICMFGSKLLVVSTSYKFEFCNICNSYFLSW